MGKWSQVRCNCPNRIPLPNSSLRDRPYRNCPYKKLSNRQKREIKIWQENIEGRYECGHYEGMLVQLYPYEIIELGFVITRVFKNDLTFEIYPKVGDWRNYFSDGLAEELRISPLEAELWLMEVAELEKAFSRQGNLPYSQVQKLISILYEREVTAVENLRQRLLRSIDDYNFSRVVPFLRNLKREVMSPDVFLEKLFGTLRDTTKLCQAAIETGHPIELLW